MPRDETRPPMTEPEAMAQLEAMRRDALMVEAAVVGPDGMIYLQGRHRLAIAPVVLCTPVAAIASTVAQLVAQAYPPQLPPDAPPPHPLR